MPGWVMEFALDQADKKLQKQSKQRAAQKKRELAKRKAAAAKAKRDIAEAEARLAARKLQQEEEDAALGGTAESRAREALQRQVTATAAAVSKSAARQEIDALHAARFPYGAPGGLLEADRLIAQHEERKALELMIELGLQFLHLSLVLLFRFLHLVHRERWEHQVLTTAQAERLSTCRYPLGHQNPPRRCSTHKMMQSHSRATHAYISLRFFPGLERLDRHPPPNHVASSSCTRTKGWPYCTRRRILASRVHLASCLASRGSC